MLGGKFASQSIGLTYSWKEIMTVVCQKVLLKLVLPLRTWTFLKRSHASTLSI